MLSFHPYKKKIVIQVERCNQGCYTETMILCVHSSSLEQSLHKHNNRGSERERERERDEEREGERERERERKRERDKGCPILPSPVTT